MTSLDTELAAPNVEVAATPARHFWVDAARRFLRNPVGLLGAVILIVLAVSAVGASLFAPYDPIALNMPNALQAPTGAHIFGTDEFGRDLFSRVLFGGRVSLPVGFIAVAIAAILGIPLGLAAGFRGRVVDSIIMRLMDIMLAFPGIILALVVISILGPSLNDVMIAVGVSGIPSYARLVRGLVLQLRANLYVDAARALGAGDSRILAMHILPNMIGPIIVLASLGVGFSILAASGLSFLGLGAQPPSPEWGAMLSTGRNYIELAWWIATFPGLMIVLAVLAMNLVGDALRDALDPRMQFR
jgi:peptide/nickel transport system permease protein